VRPLGKEGKVVSVYAIKEIGGSRGSTHLVLEGGELSIVYPSHFTLSTNLTGGKVGSRAGLDVSKKRRVSFPCHETNLGSSNP